MPLKTKTNWDPDAVSPHTGDVYEREARASDASFWIAAVSIGISLALFVIAGERIAETAMLFGMPI